MLPYKNTIHDTGVSITSTMTFEEQGEKKPYFHISEKVYEVDNLEHEEGHMVRQNYNKDII